MNTIKIIPQLNIVNGTLVAGSLNNHEKVFLKQGSVDGACGPYCLFMALLILNVISYNEATNLWWIKRSTRFGKMLKKMQEHDNLFQGGTHLYQLDELLQGSFTSTLNTTVSDARGKNLIKFLQMELSENKPVLFGVTGKNLAHWLLAIGYEEDSSGNISKILFLDPSGKELPNYYNGIIDISNSYAGRYPYIWVSESDELKISLEEGISFALK